MAFTIRYLFSALVLCLTTVSAISQNCPDLVFDQASLIILDDQRIKFEFELSNQGNGPVDIGGRTDSKMDNVRMEVSLTQDSLAVTPSDLSLGSAVIANYPIPALIPGDVFEAELEFVLPSPHRWYRYLTLELDHTQLVDECHENNNMISIEAFPCADLIPQDFHLALTDSSVEMDFLVVNRGEGKIRLGNVNQVAIDSLSYILSAKTEGGKEMTLLEDFVWSSPAHEMVHGDNHLVEVSLPLASVPTESYLISLVIDPANRISECKDDNNTLLFDPRE